MHHFIFQLSQKAGRAAALGLVATLLVFLHVPATLADDAARYKQVFEMTKSQCESGNMLACTQVGTMYLEGKGVSKNVTKAINYFHHACGKDEAKACSNLASLYYTGGVVGKDFQVALKRSRKACDLNGTDEGGNGCLIFASLLFEGRAIKKDPARVPFVLKNACRQNNAQGCESLGAAFENGRGLTKSSSQASYYLGLACDMARQESCSYILATLLYEVRDRFPFEKDPQNIQEVHALFSQACKSGVAVGCYGSGKAYFMVNNDSQGPGFWQKACDGGEARACYDLGLYKRKHVYANTSKADAIPYFEKACTKGDGRSCHMLGELHTEYSYDLNMPVSNKEMGVTASNKSAINYFTKACDSGNSLSCYNLGVHYFDGVGIASDKSRAASLFQRGCKDGLEATSCYNSGYMYASGLGVKKDAAKASRYYLLACDAGHKSGCEKVGRG